MQFLKRSSLQLQRYRIYLNPFNLITLEDWKWNVLNQMGSIIIIFDRVRSKVSSGWSPLSNSTLRNCQAFSDPPTSCFPVNRWLWVLPSSKDHHCYYQYTQTKKKERKKSWVPSRPACVAQSEQSVLMDSSSTGTQLGCASIKCQHHTSVLYSPKLDRRGWTSEEAKWMAASSSAPSCFQIRKRGCAQMYCWSVKLMFRAFKLLVQHILYVEWEAAPTFLWLSNISMICFLCMMELCQGN